MHGGNPSDAAAGLCVVRHVPEPEPGRQSQGDSVRSGCHTYAFFGRLPSCQFLFRSLISIDIAFLFGVQGNFETAVLYISISISVLSVASVVFSTQLNGVPFSNGTSEKTRMFQRYQVLYPQPFALTYELSLNHNPGWRRFRSDGSSCSFLPL